MVSVRCPQCNSPNVTYAANVTVYFEFINGKVTVDTEYLEGQLEEDTSLHHIFCTCKDCSYEFSLADSKRK